MRTGKHYGDTRMITAFISYRRIPSATLAQLLARELNVQDIKAYVDVRQVDDDGPLPTRLRDAIAKSAVFVCLVAESTFESAWVLEEIQHAHKLGKVMIPVFQESYVPIHEPPNETLRALLNSAGVKILERPSRDRNAAITQLAHMINASVTPQKTPTISIPRQWLVIGVVLTLLIAAVILGLSGIFDGSDGNNLSADKLADTKVAEHHAAETATVIATLDIATPLPDPSATHWLEDEPGSGEYQYIGNTQNTVSLTVQYDTFDHFLEFNVFTPPAADRTTPLLDTLSKSRIGVNDE